MSTLNDPRVKQIENLFITIRSNAKLLKSFFDNDAKLSEMIDVLHGNFSKIELILNDIEQKPVSDEDEPASHAPIQFERTKPPAFKAHIKTVI